MVSGDPWNNQALANICLDVVVYLRTLLAGLGDLCSTVSASCAARRHDRRCHISILPRQEQRHHFWTALTSSCSNKDIEDAGVFKSIALRIRVSSTRNNACAGRQCKGRSVHVCANPWHVAAQENPILRTGHLLLRNCSPARQSANIVCYCSVT